VKRGKILAQTNRYGQNRSNLNMELYRNEMEKDRWDVRNLGIPYNITRPDYFLSFEKIDSCFKGLVKKYVQQRLFVQDSITFATARSELINLTPFFRFIVCKYPTWSNLIHLSRSDIEEYFEHLKNQPMGGDRFSRSNPKKTTDYYLWRMIGGLENFLYLIQKYEWEEAPEKPIRKLIYQEDRPKLKQKPLDEYRYMTDEVWNQVLKHIEQLEVQYIPMMLLLEATGFRLVEVLNMRLEDIVEGSGGYWIKSWKTNSRYQYPMVPISKELANMLIAHRNQIMELFPGDKNPNGYLFLQQKTRSLGKPFLQLSVLRAFDRFADRMNIKDEDGEPYHFTAYAFRHRYGINLVNRGLNMAQIHQLLANVTSEMTMIYTNITRKLNL